jgi:SOS-response transcriptional repressor LexA
MGTETKENKFEMRRTNFFKLVEMHYGGNVAAWARDKGRNKTHASQWKKHVRNIGEESAQNIEEDFGLPKGALDYEDMLKNANESFFGTAPLLSLISAGALGKEHAPLSGEQRVPLRHVKQSASLFGLRITGDSMTDMLGKGFPEGSEVVFDTQRSPKVGDYVVAMDSTTHTATFKQLMSDGARWWLKPLNPQHSIIPIEHPDLAVTAVAVEWHMGGAL